jgi:thiol-disulfide isomerase/thioredoxin
MNTIQLVTFVLLLAMPLQAQEAEQEQAPVTTRITGTVVGADGRPMELAHVSLLLWYSREAVRTAEVDPDGGFVLETDETGVRALWFTGVDHHLEHTYLLLGEGGEIEIDARLGTHAYKDDLSDVAVIGDFNDFSFGSAREMEPQADGTYVLEIEVDADTLAYQIINVTEEGRSVNGTQSDRCVYDGGGDYRSVVDVADGVARIVFDPRKLLAVDSEPYVHYRDPESLVARYAEFRRLMEGRSSEYSEQRRGMRDQGATDEELRSFSEEYDWSANDAMLESWLEETSDPDLRATLFATYLYESVRADSLIARRALSEIEPGSPAWMLGPQLLRGAIYASRQPDVYDAYLYGALREQPGDDLGHQEFRADVLLGLLASAHEEQRAEERALFAWLVSEYPEAWQTRWALAEFDPNRAIMEGKPMPQFEVASLEDSAVIYSSENMKGQTYLMDFWAVWCGPCIGEIPYLHAAYDKYKDDGFTILSLSFDESPEDVLEYREGEWKMPWLHAFVEDGFGSEISETFQIFGIPRAILIGEGGTIVATQGDLRGEKLDETLARIFGREPAATEGEKSEKGGNR